MTLNMTGIAGGRMQAGLAKSTPARPERGNSLSRGTVDAIIQYLEEVAQDEETHTIDLRSVGSHFRAGFDPGDPAALQVTASPTRTLRRWSDQRHGQA